MTEDERLKAAFIMLINYVQRDSSRAAQGFYSDLKSFIAGKGDMEEFQSALDRAREELEL